MHQGGKILLDSSALKGESRPETQTAGARTCAESSRLWTYFTQNCGILCLYWYTAPDVLLPVLFLIKGQLKVLKDILYYSFRRFGEMLWIAFALYCPSNYYDWTSSYSYLQIWKVSNPCYLPWLKCVLEFLGQVLVRSIQHAGPCVLKGAAP